MTRFRLMLVGLAISLTASPLMPARGASPPIPVLFLGDRGHHEPADRAAQIKPVLALRGIDVTYTENLADLNPETLAKYRALVVYANIDEIAPAQEEALLDYVEGGGGFVPIHCASYCFRNSPRCVALVGAQFKSHGAGEFDTTVVDAEHPITEGLHPFRTWDETYVHDHHNADARHVLQKRGDEPTLGPGRMARAAFSTPPTGTTRGPGNSRVFRT